MAYLTAGGAPPSPALTGNYAFANLGPGTYVVHARLCRSAGLKQRSIPTNVDGVSSRTNINQRRRLGDFPVDLDQRYVSSRIRTATASATPVSLVWQALNNRSILDEQG